ncbi:LAQU0S24e00122g1_1 [Lachancea quebecensis]|uniref:Ribosome quality control complex subunit 2 n=1 Tax=Lachancea quebecensis TaxID=1654605 RepID=A0A0P1L536_9SACH|nr:LAQU0S24e00122g1_1 [Lachancea quebecensis]
MKQRISSLDLELLYRELKTQLEGYRLSNIYNVSESSRQFLLKFNKPDSKLNTIIDCGLRIHLTDFTRPVPATPSGFVVKLRKHLKSKRLTTVKRVANDRILVLSFNDGQFFLVLEFFSAGNVILLDSERKIIVLQRIVHEHENKVGHVYDMFDDSFLEDTQIVAPKTKHYSADEVNGWIKEAKEFSDSSVKAKTGKGAKVLSIHKVLFLRQPHLSSDLISRNLKSRGIAPNSPCLNFLDKIDELVDMLNATESEVNELLRDGSKLGYIIAKRNPHYDSEKGDASLEFVYEQFHPFPPHLSEDEKINTKLIEVPGQYNKTVDEFFSTIESSKYALRIQNQEFQAKNRLESAKLDNEKRIQALIDVQAKNETRGHAIIAAADLVEEAQNAIRALVEQQMDWKTIEVLISNEQKKNNRIARLIKLPLDLKNNKITLNLPLNDGIEDEDSDEEDDDSTSTEDETSNSETSDSSLSDFEADENDEDEPASATNSKKDRKDNKKKAGPSVDATIDLALSAYANASNYFNIKKSNVEKQKKVEKNAQKALKNIEQRIEKDLKKKLKESHDVLNKTRKPYFFEKFHWFISSEGFLVLMGKSGIESDQIYSKYIHANDIFVSNNFDTHVWIKNPDETEVPPNTLMQAGIMCMSASPAWSKKIQSSAWWCFAKELSKFDNYGGEVLPAGTFRLKDEKKKSFLPPSQLVMGFAFLWKTKGSDEEEEEELEADDEEQGDEEPQSKKVVVDKEIAPEGEKYKEEGLENNKNEYQRLDEDVVTEEEAAGVNELHPSTVLEESKAGQGKSDSGGVQVTEDLHHNILNSESSTHVDVEQSEQSETESEILEIDSCLSDRPGSTKESNKKSVRGKKGKMKKIQKKYADQDEEERMMRLAVLGTLKGSERQQQKAEEEAARQREREQKKFRRERQKKQQSLMFGSEQKINIDYAKIFSELSPVVDDKNKVHDIVPVYAPWPALTKYKYKVKVQPGNAKKTKSLNEILTYFSKRKVDQTESDKELDWPCEHELIKKLKELDLVSLLYTDKLKVTIPGQNESKSKAKGTSNNKGKKKGKK